MIVSVVGVFVAGPEHRIRAGFLARCLRPERFVLGRTPKGLWCTFLGSVVQADPPSRFSVCSDYAAIAACQISDIVAVIPPNLPVLTAPS